MNNLAEQNVLEMWHSVLEFDSRNQDINKIVLHAILNNISDNIWDYYDRRETLKYWIGILGNEVDNDNLEEIIVGHLALYLQSYYKDFNEFLDYLEKIENADNNNVDELVSIKIEEFISYKTSILLLAGTDILQLIQNESTKELIEILKENNYFENINEIEKELSIFRK